MSNFVEHSSDGLVLEWRAHDLTDVARHLGIAELESEPVLGTGEQAREGLLLPKVDHRGLRWSWGAWDAVELAPQAGGPAVVRRKSEAPGAEWRELGAGGPVELTPCRADGTAGTTLLVERVQPRIRFSIQQEDQLVVRVEGAAGPAAFRVELFELEEYQRVNPVGDPSPFARQGTDLVAVLEPDRGLQGAVAVVEDLGGRGRLVGWRPWIHGRIGTRSDPRVEGNLRARIEGSGPAPACRENFPSWPRRSRERLGWLAKRAPWLAGNGGPEALGRVTGTFRAAFLGELGVPGAPSPELAEQLDGGAFLGALGRRWPRLPGALEGRRNPAARIWVLLHPDDPVVEENIDEPVRLERTSETIELRRRLKILERRARQECRVLVSDLEQRVREYRGQGGSLETIKRDIQKLEEQVDREKVGRVHPDEPSPLTPEGLEAQQRWAAARKAWRQGLARVLRYGETGRWQPLEAGTSEEPADLLSRLAHLSAPPRPRKPDAVLTETVKLEIENLEAGAGWETDPVLRSEALRILRGTVRPQAGDWAGLRLDVEEAKRCQPEFPWLAQQAPAPPPEADLGERGAAARIFLALLERVEQRAAVWREARADEVGIDRAVIATPGHPAAGNLVRDIDRMREDLGLGCEDAETALPEPPVPGQGESPEAVLEAWWRYLDQLLPLHAGLAARFGVFSRGLEPLKDVLLPAFEAAAFWRRRPPAERPGYAERLGELTEKAEGGGSAELWALRQLVEFLKAHPTVQDDWHRANPGLCGGQDENREELA